MSKSNSNPARQSAGGAAGAHGTNFQAQAATWWIGQVLVGNRLLGRQFNIEENAVPIRVGAQTGTFTDDLGIEFSNGKRIFGQCKSRVHLSDNSRKKNEFASAWIQFYRQLENCGPNENPAFVLCFEEETGPLKCLGIILSRHRDYGGRLDLNDPRIAVTTSEKRIANLVLHLLKRLSCTPELAGLKTNLSRLLSCTYLHHLRMQKQGHDYLQVAQQLQSQVLQDPNRVGDAMRVILDLGNRLHQERTSTGLDQIRKELRLAGITLQDVSDHRDDWRKLGVISDAAKAGIFVNIGRQLHLQRLPEVERLIKALKASHAVTILGPSGSGKSGVVRGWVDGLDLKQDRVIWFSAAELDALSDVDLQNAFRLKFSPLHLFGAVANKNAYVVIDAIDRCFSKNGLQRVRQILEACSFEDSGCIWRVIFTCQDTEWDHVLPRLQLARVPLPVDTESTEIENLTPEEIGEISYQIPALRHLVSQHHLHELLMKPKILDLIVHHLEAGGQVEVSSLVGESQLIAWWWQAEVHAGLKPYARAAALSEIAQCQADQMRVSIPLDELSTAARELIDELVQTRLLLVGGNRVNFAHDLYGDWVRQQILVGHSIDMVGFVLPKMKSPLWQKPLRLYALHRLENSLDASAWESDWRKFAGDSTEAHLARDLFLEAVMFAANPKPILEKLWASFSVEKGALLSRFLRRFQYAASIPDSFFTDRARADGPEQVIETAAVIRIPLLSRWIPVIEFLSSHLEDVAKLVPGEIAKIAFSFFGWTVEGMRGRREMAALIVSAAEYCCRLGLHDYHSETENTVEQVYRSALRAFAEEPVRLREISLRLSGRKENDWLVKEEPKRRTPLPESVVNDPLFQEIAGIGTTPIGGPVENWEVVGPWPDGPQFAVSEEFRNAFLNGDANRVMIKKNPKLASEVFLSLLIEHAHRVSPFEIFGSSRLDENKGLQSMPSLNGPFYSTGPYLYFLQSNEEEGLAFIIKFINFASQRWAEQFSHRDQEIWKVNVHISGEDRVLFGDWGLYYAYRNASWIHPAIRASTMALEKWLHDKIQQNVPIDETIDRIVEHSRSVAIAGVLIAIGKRRNTLFWTNLWPVTCVAQFHVWEDSHNSQFVPGTANGWNEPPQQRERRKKWNDLPFRREDLLKLCINLFLKDTGGRKKLGRLKNVWSRQIRGIPKNANSKSTLFSLSQCFDIKNWALGVNEAGEKTWIFTPPPARTTKTDEEPIIEVSTPESEIKELGKLPAICHHILEGGDYPFAHDPAELWELLEFVMEIAREQSGEPYGLRDPQDAVAGVIAVIFKLHQDWLRADPEREKMCIENLAAVPERAIPSPEPTFYDSNGQETFWAFFCAMLLPTIWADSPFSPSIRAAIGRLAISATDSTLALLMQNLFLVRQRLGAGFEQIQTLVLHDAVERERHKWVRALEEDPERYSKWIVKEIADFSQGYSRVFPTDWLAIRHPQFPMPHSNSYSFEKKTEQQIYGLDYDRVVGAFAWIMPLNNATSPLERIQWLSIRREILQCLIGTFPPLEEGSEEYAGVPYQVDRDVLKTSAKLVLELTDQEDYDAFWKPVLALGESAHSWVEDFIRDFFMSALETPMPPECFARRWKTMLHFAESSPVWQKDSSGKPWELEKLWLNLIGIDPILQLCWLPEHRDIIAQIWPNLERWGRNYLREPASLSAFLDFMKLPLVSEWIPDALILINEALASCSPDLAEEFPEDKFARFLVFINEKHSSEVRRNPDAYEVFKRWVANLAAAQNRIALELQTHLSEGSH